MAKPLNDMLVVLKRVFKLVRYAGLLLLGVTLLLIGRQVADVFRAAEAIHPALGWAFVVAVSLLVVRLLGVPVYRFIKMPAVISPPRLPDKKEDVKPVHVKRQAEFLGRYLAHLRRNPLLEADRAKIGAARVKLSELRGRLADLPGAGAAHAEVVRFEKETLDPLLKPLDKEVDRLIRNEALGVGVATALSPNGTLDSFIVLWRNANLVSRIANVYYGRPGVRGSLRILGDVGSAALLASYLQGLSEAAGGVLRGVFGSVVGVVAGPLLDGGVNAVATLRMGHLAKARCRSFKAWSEGTIKEALHAALAAARERSKDVVVDVAKAAGGGLVGLTGKVTGAVKGGLSALFRKLAGEGEGDADAEPATT